jgi:hypothetical protein
VRKVQPWSAARLCPEVVDPALTGHPGDRASQINPVVVIPAKAETQRLWRNALKWKVAGRLAASGGWPCRPSASPMFAPHPAFAVWISLRDCLQDCKRDAEGGA